MKRILLVAAGVAAVVSASAAPVFAGSAAAGSTDSHTSLIVGAERFVADTANPILRDVPTPDGWHHRFLCAWNYQTNQQVCLFFPWPA